MSRANKRNYRVFLFCASFLVLAVAAVISWVVVIGGNDSDSQGRAGGDGQVASSEPDVEWITRVVRVSVLERLIHENGSEEVMGNAHHTAEERLEEGGVLVGEGSGQRVQVDREEWNFGKGISENEIHTGLVDSALAEVMRTNNVTWCGGERPADDFVE